MELCKRALQAKGMVLFVWWSTNTEYQILCVCGEGAGWVLCDLSCAAGGKTVKNCPWMAFVAERGGGFHLFCELREGKDQALGSLVPGFSAER